MRVFKIDAEKQEVTELNVELDLKKIYELVGCDLICLGPEIGENSTFVDDEGLLKGPTHFFAVQGGRQPYAGNAVVVGPTDDEGEITDAVGTLEKIQAAVKFFGSGELK